MMSDLGVIDLLKLAGFEASPGDRIVRHQHGKYPVNELRSQDLLEVYQAYQSKPVFHKAQHVVSLCGLDGTRACLFGVFTKVGWRKPQDRPPLTASRWESEWRDDTKFFYQLDRISGFEHLEDRVIVEWGRGALAWCQQLVNKPVLEITAPGRKLAPFRDYLEFTITHSALVDLYKNEEAHREWRARLQAVAGVYLILAETTGKLYVGSASGAEGIWGRWREYAKTGHGNNKQLKELIASNPGYPRGFRFSILQIVPRSMTRQDVIEHESRLKAKLGCLAFGLNSN
jgi:hypothetical protein